MSQRWYEFSYGEVACIVVVAVVLYTFVFAAPPEGIAGWTSFAGGIILGKVLIAATRMLARGKS